MKTYILINPYNYKVIHFSEFKNDNFTVAKTSIDLNGQFKLEKKNAICIEVDFDEDLLDKTYDPVTETFE